MKWGIPVLIIGVLMLFASIPFSVMVLLTGFSKIAGGDTSSGGILTYLPLAGAVIGLMMTTIGATHVFKD